MKQAAVEWLVSRLTDNTGGIYTTDGTSDVTEFVKQAKEMEKQQILDAHMEGHYVISHPVYPEIEAEKYFNKTFNQEK